MNTIQYLIAFVLTGICFCTYGQNKYEWKQARSGDYTYKYVTNDPMETRFYTLKNGLTVILSPNKTEPRVSVRIAVRAGSNDDPSNHTGLAHYLEHLLFKGTDKYGTLNWQKEQPLLQQIDKLYEQYSITTDTVARKAIYKQIDHVSYEASTFAIANEYTNMMSALGSKGTNAHTSVEETVYEEDIPSNAMDKFLAIEAERFRNPVIRLFHTELEAVYEEKNRGLDNDNNKMQEAMLAAVFPTHNYGLQTTIGTIEDLKNPSIEAIKAFYKRYYLPNNMAIIMAGDFSPDDLIKKIDKNFGYMIAKPVEGYKGTVEKPIQGIITKEVFGPSAESVRIAFRSPANSTRDAMFCDMIGSILFNGKAGLIDVNLIQQQKLLQAWASLWQLKDYGIFILNSSPKQGQSLEEVKDLLLAQIKILKEGRFDESLIKATAANYKLELMEGLQNNGNRVGSIVEQYIQNKGMKWDKNVAYIDDMQKISKKGIVDFANSFFKDDNYVILYKRKGEDKNIIKVEKPPISPIETNAGKESVFVRSILDSPLTPIQPVWLDYKKDITIEKQGIADVLYVPNKKNDLFTLSYRFDMGTWNNRVLSIAIRYLDYLSTDKYTAAEISRKFYELACNFSIKPGEEETIITISGLQENFDEAVSLFENLLTKCLPNEQALEGLKNNIFRSRANAKLNKQAIGEALRDYAIYGAHNPFNDVLSNEEIKNLKATDLIELLHSLTSYEHRICYYGPATMHELLPKLKNIHAIPASWKTNAAKMKFERLNQTKAEVLFTSYDAVQAEVFWIRNLDKYDPEKEAIVNLYNNYFGGGMGSIVFKSIRESKALAYSTYAFVLTPADKGDRFSMVAYVGTQADKFNEAVTSMNELFKEMPMFEQNFAMSQQKLIRDVQTERITGDAIISNYLNAKRKGIDHDIRIDNYKKYKSLRLEDLYNFHQQQVSNVPFTYCVIASDKKVQVDELKKYGDLKIISLKELFGF
ncbi:MAG: insulinase family protein [Bacteroidetes bacterium]|nr:insulinase family protein [Bacteroidota bacterium]